jgi:hypothetical protein
MMQTVFPFILFYLRKIIIGKMFCAETPVVLPFDTATSAVMLSM